VRKRRLSRPQLAHAWDRAVAVLGYPERRAHRRKAAADGHHALRESGPRSGKVRGGEYARIIVPRRCWRGVGGSAEASRKTVLMQVRMVAILCSSARRRRRRLRGGLRPPGASDLIIHCTWRMFECFRLGQPPVASNRNHVRRSAHRSHDPTSLRWPHRRDSRQRPCVSRRFAPICLLASRNSRGLSLGVTKSESLSATVASGQRGRSSAKVVPRSWVTSRLHR